MVVLWRAAGADVSGVSGVICVGGTVRGVVCGKGVVEATVVVVLSGIDGGATVTATMAVVAGAVVGGSVVKATDAPGVSGWVLGPFELLPTTSHNKPAVSTAAPMPSAAVGDRKSTRLNSSH